MQGIDIFIAAGIKRSENNRLIFHFLQYVFISFKLRFLCRQNGSAAFHKQKFRTKQSDAVRSVFDDRIDVFLRADVCVNNDLSTVFCLCLFIDKRFIKLCSFFLQLDFIIVIGNKLTRIGFEQFGRL